VNRQIINRRYRVERKIGEGATAEVFLGFDIVLNRRVALKTLRLQYAANRAFRLRFEREAQSAASLAHPNVIAIFDVGEDNGLPFIVMEYVEGQTLKEIIQSEGPFHPDDVAILVEQVAAGLDFAHKNGLVHRDVKPQNILVDRHGLAKVVDFGIAKGLADSNLTETGTGLGTVQYISPEQASGLMATPESDIYSLGVIAYEMLTGQLPFESTSSVGVAMRHLNDPPPDPASVNPDVPPEAADIVLQALEKNPTRRFPTAGAFARALGDWRLYEPAPRLAAKYTAAPAASTLRDRTAHEPVPGSSLSNDEPEDELERDYRIGSPFEESERRSKSWIAGLLAVAGIAAFLWYGFDVQDRIRDRGNEQPTATAELGSAGDPASTAAATEPTDVPQAAGVSVPNVVGQSQTVAEQTLSTAGFTVAYLDEVPSDSIPEGSVAEQDPPASFEAARGDTVTLHLSSGVRRIDLTALKVEGRDEESVYAELTSLGLNASGVFEGSETVEEGLVTRIDPADSAAPDDVITVYVSKGDRVQIPRDLQFQPREAGRDRLESLGFTVSGEIPVSRQVIEQAGISWDEAGIDDGEIVGVQDNGAQFGGWIDRGASVTIVYYDASLDAPEGETSTG
jgi:serine/threonine-protein kinase